MNKAKKGIAHGGEQTVEAAAAKVEAVLLIQLQDHQ